MTIEILTDRNTRKSLRRLLSILLCAIFAGSSPSAIATDNKAIVQNLIQQQSTLTESFLKNAEATLPSDIQKGKISTLDPLLSEHGCQSSALTILEILRTDPSIETADNRRYLSQARVLTTCAIGQNDLLGLVIKNRQTVAGPMMTNVLSKNEQASPSRTLQQSIEEKVIQPILTKMKQDLSEARQRRIEQIATNLLQSASETHKPIVTEILAHIRGQVTMLHGRSQPQTQIRVVGHIFDQMLLAGLHLRHHKIPILLTLTHVEHDSVEGTHRLKDLQNLLYKVDPTTSEYMYHPLSDSDKKDPAPLFHMTLMSGSIATTPASNMMEILKKTDPLVVLLALAARHDPYPKTATGSLVDYKPNPSLSINIPTRLTQMMVSPFKDPLADLYAQARSIADTHQFGKGTYATLSRTQESVRQGKQAITKNIETIVRFSEEIPLIGEHICASSLAEAEAKADAIRQKAAEKKLPKEEVS